MEFNEYNEGELETVGDGSRYVTSAHFGDERLSIAIIAAILVLAVLVWSVFALFTEESIPVWNPSGSSGSSSSSSTTTGNGSYSLGQRCRPLLGKLRELRWMRRT